MLVDLIEIKAFIGLLYLAGVYKSAPLKFEDLWASNEVEMLVDLIEIKAFIGLLYLAGVYKSAPLKFEDLWASNGDGTEIFRLTISLSRFRFIIRCLRLDDRETRPERKQLDRLCPDIELLTKNNEQRNFFKDLVASSLKDLNSLDNFVINTFIILTSVLRTPQTELALANIKATAQKGPTDTEKVQSTENTLSDLPGETTTTLHKASPFYKRYLYLTKNITMEQIGTEKNIFYNKEFMDIILNKYLPFCSLYTGLMLNNSPLILELGRVVQFVRKLREDVVSIKTEVDIGIRKSRLTKTDPSVRKLREDVVSIKTEVDIGIRKSRLTKTDPSDEKCSQERWAKRGKKAGTHFMGKYLQNVSSAVINDTILYPEDDKDTAQCGYCGQGMLDETTMWVINDTILYPEDDKDTAQCGYCGQGMLDETTMWVQCDTCQRWIHQTCDVSTENKNKMYSGDFVCNLELSTKFQRNSTIWREPRKIRVTSSFVGRICKAREASSFENIVNSITTDRTINTPATIHGTICEDLARETSDRTINTPATIHGTMCEDLARETYVKQTNTVCQRAGLFLHKDYPFLGGSPDGLLESNGLLEIKSPYNARNCDPNSYHFEFLNKSDYSIKMNHHYYYQVQGLLEITDRRDERWILKQINKDPKKSAPTLAKEVEQHLTKKFIPKILEVCCGKNELHGRIAKKKPYISEKIEK
ncbi:YqaJ-like viral recombinase domain [Popillia japonica]|uniref:YqaJ-like viral recombinase domain n=1 Tax=Popillia japonica TaxID=7064 RepID=A0AAW1ITT1_POPJA